MEKKTKIVCTIGPASENPEMIKKLVNEGMNIARLNFSHGSYEEQGARVKMVRDVSKELKKPIGILLFSFLTVKFKIANLPDHVNWIHMLGAGILGGVEQTKSGRTLAIVDYKGFRVAIPILEMLLYTGEMPSNREYLELMGRLNRMLSTMLGAEIDFMVKGIDSNTRSIVASRKDAMLRKRQSFYMDTDALGEHLIYEGRVVQARVIAVAEKIIRVEAFGVECAIVARDLSWEWLGDARDHFSVGSRILIRIQTIDRSSLEGMTITADVRSVSSTTNLDNVKKCQPQCRYAGRVTDVRGGVVYIRLNNGVNAIAHACYDLRTPGKKDDVSFAVTRLDEEKGIAIGIITRIIKQNL